MRKGNKKKEEETRTRTWLAARAAEFLKRVGLAEGQTVLDFGCNKGNYARPTARIVGPGGKVYAVDKDKKVLQELRRAAKREALSNMKCIHVSEDGKLPLRAGSVDIVLLYDVLHRGYLPEVAQRRRVLQEIHRVVKQGGLLSFFPTHLKQYGLTMQGLIGEVCKAGFKLRGESRRRLVHDGKLVRGRILAFRRGRNARSA